MRKAVALIAAALLSLVLLPCTAIAEAAHTGDPWADAPLSASSEMSAPEGVSPVTSIMITKYNTGLVPGVRPAFTTTLDPSDSHAGSLRVISQAWQDVAKGSFVLYPEQSTYSSQPLPTAQKGVTYKLCLAIDFGESLIPTENMTVSYMGKSYKASVLGTFGGPDESENTYMVLIEHAVTCQDAIPLYRMYNTKTSEHLWTRNKKEYESAGSGSYKDWKAEGIAWYVPRSSGAPVYRLYNTKSGDHHYTTSLVEKTKLVGSGQWRDEGVAFYSATAKDTNTIKVYRVYNSRLKRGQHHYTKSAAERDSLVKSGSWKDEGTSFYGYAKPAFA